MTETMCLLSQMLALFATDLFCAGVCSSFVQLSNFPFLERYLTSVT